MIASPLIAIAVVASGPSFITPEQAAKSAMAFFNIVGVQQPYSLASARLDNTGYSRMYGVPTYVVVFKRSDPRAPLGAAVDATNGEVIYAYDQRYRSNEQLGDRALSTRWTARLGHNAAWASEGHLAAKIGRFRFFNLNGFTGLTWMTNKGHFAFYNGIGATPGLPAAKPRISAEQAKRMAIAIRKKKVPNWAGKLETRSELGLFYDQKKSAAVWAWKVSEGTVTDIGFADSFTKYLNAESGEAIDDQYYQSSCYPYHSRKSCPTLNRSEPAAIDAPAYRLAKQRLKDLGREGVLFCNIDIGKGIKMYSNEGQMIEVGPTGQIIAFRAHGASGQMNPGTAGKKGEAFIKMLHPVLPQGRFRVAKSRFGNFTAVVYGQTALGYDYLESEVVSAHFDKDGKVVGFMAYAPKPKPACLPPTMLSASQMEARAKSLVVPLLPASNPQVTHSAEAKAGKIGWFYVDSLRKTRLCCSIYIGTRRDIKGYAIQGGGGTYHMDVETGTVYGWRGRP